MTAPIPLTTMTPLLVAGLEAVAARAAGLAANARAENAQRATDWTRRISPAGARLRGSAGFRRPR